MQSCVELGLDGLYVKVRRDYCRISVRKTWSRILKYGFSQLSNRKSKTRDELLSQFWLRELHSWMLCSVISSRRPESFRVEINAVKKVIHGRLSCISWPDSSVHRTLTARLICCTDCGIKCCFGASALACCEWATRTGNLRNLQFDSIYTGNVSYGDDKPLEHRCSSARTT